MKRQNILTCLLATFLLILSSAAKAQDIDALRPLCDLVKPPFNEMGVTRQLSRAAGIKSSDDEAQQIEKVRALWKNPQANNPEKDGLYCLVPGTTDERGTLLHTLLGHYGWNVENILNLVWLGANINMVDQRTGKTLLDDVLLQAQRYSGDGWISPQARRFDADRLYRAAYISLRNEGARHAAELTATKSRDYDEGESLCLQSQAGDVPTHFSDYSGGLSADLSKLTPSSVPGAKTVSVRQAACLIAFHEARMDVFAIMKDRDGLPGAVKLTVPGIPGNFTDKAQDWVNDFAGNYEIMDKPLLVYCHSSSCFLSYNAVLRLSEAGFTRIYWMRDGLAGWRAAGYPVAPANGFLIGER